jgi:hypothetical protein
MELAAPDSLSEIFRKFQKYHMQRIPASTFHKTWCDINELNQISQVLSGEWSRGEPYFLTEHPEYSQQAASPIHIPYPHILRT